MGLEEERSEERLKSIIKKKTFLIVISINNFGEAMVLLQLDAFGVQT